MLEESEKSLLGSDLTQGFVGMPTCRFTRKPEWLNDLSPTARVSQADAINGLFAAVRPIRAIPGPTNPIDCREAADLVLNK